MELEIFMVYSFVVFFDCFLIFIVFLWWGCSLRCFWDDVFFSVDNFSGLVVIILFLAIVYDIYFLGINGIGGDSISNGFFSNFVLEFISKYKFFWWCKKWVIIKLVCFGIFLFCLVGIVGGVIVLIINCIGDFLGGLLEDFLDVFLD